MRGLAGLTLALGLVACASAPPANPLDVATRSTLRVTQVGVTWSGTDAGRAADADYVMDRSALMAKLQVAVEQEFRDYPRGVEPVALRIDVQRYDRANVLASNVVGAPNGVTATVTITRLADGKVMAVYKDVRGSFGRPGGLVGAAIDTVRQPDVVSGVADGFAASLRQRFNSMNPDQYR